MNIAEALSTRKSIRGYRPEPIPKETLKEILDIATRAPSGENAQPWELVVIAGEMLQRIGQTNIEKLNSGILPHPEVNIPMYKDTYKQRQVDLAIQLFHLMGITREDKTGRLDWLQRGFRFFDAPAAVFILLDGSLDMTHTLVDIGTLAQSICLAALHHHLGSCIQQQGVFYPDVVKELAGIPQSKRVLLCVTLGYTDHDFPANQVQSTREPIERISTWIGFD